MIQLGRESKVFALNVWWTISRLELRHIREFRDWIASQLPDPLAIGEAYFKLLPQEEQVARIKRAEQTKNELRCFSLKSDLAQEYLSKEEGMARMGQIMLREHHPDITEDQAFAIWIDAMEEMQEAMAEAQGEMSNRGNSVARTA